MNTIFNKTADTVVCHLALLYRLLKEETGVIRNHIYDVINYLKKGCSLERGICLVLWKFLRQIPRYPKFQRTNTPALGKKRKKLGIGRREEYTPFINQSEDRIHI
jgi:hypothetical protein